MPTFAAYPAPAHMPLADPAVLDPTVSASRLRSAYTHDSPYDAVTAWVMAAAPPLPPLPSAAPPFPPVLATAPQLPLFMPATTPPHTSPMLPPLPATHSFCPSIPPATVPKHGPSRPLSSLLRAALPLFPSAPGATTKLPPLPESPATSLPRTSTPSFTSPETPTPAPDCACAMPDASNDRNAAPPPQLPPAPELPDLTLSSSLSEDEMPDTSFATSAANIFVAYPPHPKLPGRSRGEGTLRVRVLKTPSRIARGFNLYARPTPDTPISGEFSEYPSTNTDGNVRVRRALPPVSPTRQPETPSPNALFPPTPSSSHRKPLYVLKTRFGKENIEWTNFARPQQPSPLSASGAVLCNRSLTGSLDKNTPGPRPTKQRPHLTVAQAYAAEKAELSVAPKLKAVPDQPSIRRRSSFIQWVRKQSTCSTSFLVVLVRHTNLHSVCSVLPADAQEQALTKAMKNERYTVIRSPTHEFNRVQGDEGQAGTYQAAPGSGILLRATIKLARSPPSTFPSNLRTHDETTAHENGLGIGGTGESDQEFRLRGKASRSTDSLHELPCTEPKALARKPTFVRARQSLSGLMRRISTGSRPSAIWSHSDAHDQDDRAFYGRNEPYELQSDDNLDTDLKWTNKRGDNRLSSNLMVPEGMTPPDVRGGQQYDSGSMLVATTPGTLDARMTLHRRVSGSNGQSLSRGSYVPWNGSVAETRDPLRRLQLKLNSTESSMHDGNKSALLLPPSPNARSGYDLPHLGSSARTDPRTSPPSRLSVVGDVQYVRPDDSLERTTGFPGTLGASSTTSALHVSTITTSPMENSPASVPADGSIDHANGSGHPE